MGVCSVTMCLLFMDSESPKEVLMDAFGITFLYNLDDLSGEVSFLDEKWDEDFMGDVYGEMASSPGMLEDIKAERQGKATPDNVYEVAIYIMRAMLFILPLLNIFLVTTPASGRRLDGPSADPAQFSELTFGEFVRY